MTQEQWTEVTGSDIEEAIESGLRRLGLARQQVIIEVIDEGRRGILGLGSRDAVVRIRPLPRPVQSRSTRPAAAVEPAAEPVVEEAGEEEEIDAASAPPAAQVRPEPEQTFPTPAAETAPPVTLATTAEPAPAAEVEVKAEPVAELEAADFAEEEVEQEDEEEADFDEDGADLPEWTDVEATEVARGIVQTLLEKMGFAEVEVSATYSEPDDKTGRVMPVIQIEGDDLNNLIGPHGNSLADLQYVARLMAGHALRSRANFIIDVNHYRERRQEALAKMAQRMADKAVDRDETVTLEAMSAYDRRLIHMALRDDERVYTNSVGEGANRRVRVFVKK